MNLLIKKKQFVLSALVVMLGVAVFVNWYYTKPDAELKTGGENTTSVAEGNLGEAEYVNTIDDEEYFATVKLNRSNAHDEAIDTLKLLISDDSSEEEVSNAALTIQQFSNKLKQETDVESLVTAKTGSECVAVINQDKIEIVVANQILNDNSALQIKEIVIDNTDIPVENITIIGVK